MQALSAGHLGVLQFGVPNKNAPVASPRAWSDDTSGPFLRASDSLRVPV